MIRSCATVSLVPELKGGPWIYWDAIGESCRRAAAIGFDAVELFHRAPDALPAEQLERVLNDNGLSLAGVGTGAGKVLRGLTLTDPDAAVRKKAREFIADMIAFGATFGAPAIIGSMQGNAASPAEREQTLDWLAEGLGELAGRAADLGTRLIYEPLNRYESNLVNTQAAGVDLVNRSGSDNVFLLADLFHMNIEETSIAAGLRDGGRHVGHVHFVDSNRRPAGLGHIDFAAVAEALQDIRYDAYASAEAFPYPDSDTAALQTFETFQQHLKPT